MYNKTNIKNEFLYKCKAIYDKISYEFKILKYF